MYVQTTSSLQNMKDTFINTNAPMSRFNTQYQSHNYSDRQEILYYIHQALQNIATHIFFVHTFLVRTSSVLIDALHAYRTYDRQKIRNCLQSLKDSIHQLVNLNHNLGGFREYVVPFNISPLPPRVPSSS